MTTLKHVLIALITAGSVFSASLALCAKDSPRPASDALAKAPLLERPAVAAALVARAPKAAKESVALELVSSIAKTEPDLLAAVVNAVASELPRAAAKIASTAAQLAPDRLFDIAKAAAAGAPKKAEDVVLALAALQPKELLKICLAISRAVPSEAGRVVVPLARAFPLQADVIYSGLVNGAPAQEAAVATSLLKTLPGLENTEFGRHTRSDLASGTGTVRRRVAVIAKTIDVINALAKKLEAELKTQATQAGVTTDATLSDFASGLLNGSISVNTETGQVQVDPAKIDPNSDVGKAFAQSPTLKDEFVAAATTQVQNEINNSNSELNKALQNQSTTDEQISEQEKITVILTKDTVREYNK